MAQRRTTWRFSKRRSFSAISMIFVNHAGMPHVWGAGGSGRPPRDVVRRRKSLSEYGTEGTIVDGASNLARTDELAFWYE